MARPCLGFAFALGSLGPCLSYFKGRLPTFSAALLVHWRGLAWPLALPCLAFAFALGSFGACLPTFTAALLVLWRRFACPLAPLGLAFAVALGSFGARALVSEMQPKHLNPRHFGRVCIPKRCSPEPAGRKSRNSLPIYSYYSFPLALDYSFLLYKPSQNVGD